MVRRFEAGKHLRYDTAYQNCESRSRILHPATQGLDSLCLQMSDLSGCQKALSTLRGDIDGYCFDSSGRRVDSQIKSQQAVVAELENEIKARKAAALAEGHLCVPSDNPESSNEWLTATAKLDVLLTEAAELESRIARFQAAQQAAEDDRLRRRLRRPLGAGRLDDRGRLAEIDLQRVEIIGDVATIADPRSPYNTWPVEKYRREVVLPFAKGTRKSA